MRAKLSLMKSIMVWEEVKDFVLFLFDGEKDVYPSVAEYGQQVINQQVEGKYDLFVGIMKGRFGTPTPQAGSGTEEG